MSLYKIIIMGLLMFVGFQFFLLGWHEMQHGSRLIACLAAGLASANLVASRNILHHSFTGGKR